MMENIMIDLETLSTQSDAAILSIGAVFFDKTGLGPEFYRTIDLQSCIDEGLTIDGDTFYWWMQQSDEARKAIFFSEKFRPLRHALLEFGNFYTQYYKQDNTGVDYKIKLWGNGASFDNPIIDNAFKACEFKTPWQYSDHRCFRTLRKLFPEVEWEDFKGVAHNALDDAKNQALHAVKILNYMSYGNK